MTRDDRVAYVYLSLIDKKNRSTVYKIIEDMGITSVSTAQRTAVKIDKWSKSERELFLATFTPAAMDLHQLKDILEEKENDSLTEIAVKNEELQKELHTSKKVIETLQNEVIEKMDEIKALKFELQDKSNKHKILQDELAEQIEESRKTIIELCKERDEKAEEIRLLDLEMQKYQNDINTVLEDRNKLELLLHDDAKKYESRHPSKDSMQTMENFYLKSCEEKSVASDFREIIEEMIQLYISKNKDYGNAFKQSYDEFGAVMAVIRINDKLNRFKTLIKQNNEVKTESIKDTLIDLANYAVMTIIEMERKNDNTY